MAPRSSSSLSPSSLVWQRSNRDLSFHDIGIFVISTNKSNYSPKDDSREVEEAQEVAREDPSKERSSSLPLAIEHNEYLGGGGGGHRENEADYNLRAQQLINGAARCIETGYYTTAIGSLHKALQFAQVQTSRETLSRACACRECAINGNIDFDDASCAVVPSPADGDRVQSKTSGRRPRPREGKVLLPWWSTPTMKHRGKENDTETRPSNSTTKLDFDNTGDDVRLCWTRNEDEHYQRNFLNNGEAHIPSDVVSGGGIYQVPIRVTREGHQMGSAVLFLVIAFNLSLAYHLDVIAPSSDIANDNHNHNNRSNSTVEKTLSFYELTSKYEKRLRRCVSIGNGVDKNKNSTSWWDCGGVHCCHWDVNSSIRFNTILRINLNRLALFYSTTKQRNKDDRLHRLLSKAKAAIEHEINLLQKVQTNHSNTNNDRSSTTPKSLDSSLSFSDSSDENGSGDGLGNGDGNLNDNGRPRTTSGGGGLLAKIVAAAMNPCASTI